MMLPNMNTGRTPLHEQGLQEGRRPDGTAVYVPPPREPDQSQETLDASPFLSQPRVETSEFGKMMRRMVRAYGRRVADADVEDLADMIAVRDELDQQIAEAVHTSRQRHGRSWADIARATNTTRQAAQQRWGKESTR
jgi:hypothetical protein